MVKGDIEVHQERKSEVSLELCPWIRQNALWRYDFSICRAVKKSELTAASTPVPSYIHNLAAETRKSPELL